METTPQPDTGAQAAAPASQPAPTTEPGPAAHAGPAAQPAPTGRGTRLTTDIALVATFAALTAVCSLLAVQVTAGPITLQTFAVLLAGAVLGAKRGSLAVLLYLAVGAAGLPVFSGGRSGLPVLVGATGGYLLAFPVAAFVVGLLVQRIARRTWTLSVGLIAAACVVGSLVVYAGGVPVMAWRTGMSLGEAFVANLAFVPFDAVKVVLASVVAASVHRAFPDLLPRR